MEQNKNWRRSANDGCTTHHEWYTISQRKRIKALFDWINAAAGFRKARQRGKDHVCWMFTLNAAAYNLIRLPKLLAA